MNVERDRANHVAMLTGYTVLADDEAFEYAKARAGKFTRHVWRDRGDFLQRVDQAVRDSYDVYVGLGIRCCPKGGVVGHCGCDHPFDREHVSRVMAAAADLD